VCARVASKDGNGLTVDQQRLGTNIHQPSTMFTQMRHTLVTPSTLDQVNEEKLI